MLGSKQDLEGLKIQKWVCCDKVLVWSQRLSSLAE